MSEPDHRIRVVWRCVAMGVPPGPIRKIAAIVAMCLISTLVSLCVVWLIDATYLWAAVVGVLIGGATSWMLIPLWFDWMAAKPVDPHSKRSTQ